MATASVTELRAGKKNKRLEAAIEEGLDAGVDEVARELAGSGSPKMFRSEATRVLLAEAILARRNRASRISKA